MNVIDQRARTDKPFERSEGTIWMRARLHRFVPVRPTCTDQITAANSPLQSVSIAPDPRAQWILPLSTRIGRWAIPGTIRLAHWSRLRNPKRVLSVRATTASLLRNPAAPDRSKLQDARCLVRSKESHAEAQSTQSRVRFAAGSSSRRERSG